MGTEPRRFNWLGCGTGGDGRADGQGHAKEAHLTHVWLKRVVFVGQSGQGGIGASHDAATQRYQQHKG